MNEVTERALVMFEVQTLILDAAKRSHIMVPLSAEVLKEFTLDELRLVRDELERLVRSLGGRQ